MTAENIIFSQNEFLSTSFATFQDMRKRGHLCDLTIKVQNRSFSAHRVILTAGIPYFDPVFNGLETADNEFAVGGNLDPDGLELLIDFAYTGMVTISSENVQSLLEAAQFLQLSQVQNACLAFLSKELNSENIGKVSTLACALNSTEVIESSNVYIRENFEEFSKCEEFLCLPFDCLKEIISGDDLNVSSEEIVFEALIRWVRGSPSERQNMLPELLGEIRLTYLSVEYLMEKVESEELIMSSKCCRDLVKEVKYYHMMPERVSGVSNLKTCPRNCLKKDLYAVCACSTCGSYVYRYDSHETRWHVLSSTETPCNTSNSGDWNNTVAVNGKIYRFFQGNRIQTFDIQTLEWDSRMCCHGVREGATLVSHENMIYCFYPYGNKGEDKVLCFDTQLKITKEGNLPNIQRYAAGASLGNTIYITGGNHNYVGKYIPSTGQWTTVAPMLLSRAHHYCTSLKGKIYVCGIRDESRMEVYDPSTDQWNSLPFLDSKLPCVALVSDHDKIYVFTENSGESYDPRTHRWKSVNAPRCLVSVVSLTTFNRSQRAIDANEKAVE